MEGYVRQRINPALPAKGIPLWRDGMWSLQYVNIQVAVLYWHVCSARARGGGYYSVNPVSCSIGVEIVTYMCLHL